uniref:Uncharacterized protein n=1 Tax=Leersia perrieri TaxID=77586 RepID=A0A0D9W2R2_9ORYZ
MAAQRRTDVDGNGDLRCLLASNASFFFLSPALGSFTAVLVLLWPGREGSRISLIVPAVPRIGEDEPPPSWDFVLTLKAPRSAR